MSIELSFVLAQIALRTARSAFSHFVCCVVPGAAPQLENVASQSRSGMAPPPFVIVVLEFAIVHLSFVVVHPLVDRDARR
jgi:hypothetical protein